MKIRDKEDAQEAIEQICEWLSLNDNPSKKCGESEATDLARGWSRELLEAASCNGLGGCLLCQS